LVFNGTFRARDKTRRGLDLNGDSLQISRACLRISDHCRVTVRVRNMVRVSIRVSVRVADCCIQTAGKSVKMQIYHVIQTDQWRCTLLHILSCPHFQHKQAISCQPQDYEMYHEGPRDNIKHHRTMKQFTKPRKSQRLLV